MRLAAVLTFVPALAAQATSSYAEHLERLVRVRPCSGPTVQFASYDRRSTAPGAPHWFANSDGFGREPIPGFLATLVEPDARGRGKWLVAEVEGPGAIVRTWSAGMAGTLEVRLDDGSAPIYRGPADRFLRRKSEVLLAEAGIELPVEGSFAQQDADYLPIPFTRRLTMTWEGRLDELHFYHVTVARGAPGDTPGEAFSLDLLRRHRAQLARIDALLRGTAEDASLAPGTESAAELQPGGSSAWDVPGPGPDAAREGCIERLALRCKADDVATALRGTILRIRFDGASVAQVEAPLGDFFLSAPGVQPQRSVAMQVEADGWMACTLPMPFTSGCRIELHNTTGGPVAVEGRVHVRTSNEEERRLGTLHAKWRVQHDLVATPEGRDIPYLFARGEGVLVGVACMLVNPTGIPTAGGSWWGEGDEKIWVDDDVFPSTFGTGSEDFFNYAWSRPDLFALPHCGQPTCTGPGTSGYVTNYRWLFADCVPFRRSLACMMELKHHRRIEGFSYASIAFWYAGPSAIDDHRDLTARDLFVPPLRPLGVVADGGARGATIVAAEQLEVRGGTELRTWDEPLATRHRLVGFTARGSERAAFALPIEADGRYELHVVALHRADAAPLRVLLDGNPLVPLARSAGGTVGLRRASTCVQDVAFAPVDLRVGVHEMTFVAEDAGIVGLDTVWWKRRSPIPFKAEGAHEGEALARVGTSPGLAVEVQALDAARWSGGEHLWVRATRDGEFVDLELPVARPGRHVVELCLTRSWDYGIVQAFLDGVPAGEPIDTYNHEARTVAPAPVVALPPRTLAPGARLRLQVVGSSPESSPPGRYFGLDWVRLRRVD
ncbi:MAG TPA: glycoside hydrolase family 172 protein [Planctomycetota bacterium]|nr:glycoside hydrolase family 172 protein [Planctomycetota bacterium]